MLPSPLLLRSIAASTALYIAPVFSAHDAAASPSPSQVTLVTTTATMIPRLARIPRQARVPAHCRALPLMLHHHARASESRVDPADYWLLVPASAIAVRSVLHHPASELP